MPALVARVVLGAGGRATVTAGGRAAAVEGAGALGIGVRTLTAAQRAEQMRRAQEIARALAAAAAASCATGQCPCHKTVIISQSAYPESANHILDAQAAGHPVTLTIDRGGARARRQAATGSFPREPGKQPDEYPPAMFLEGGAGASVRNITASDNMGAGASMGNQLRPETRYPDGCKATIIVGP